MTAHELLRFLASYSLQLALVLGAGIILPFAVGVRQPKVLLRYWQLLVVGALALPLVAVIPAFDGSSSPTPAAATLLVDEVVAAGATEVGGRSLSWLVLFVVVAGTVVRVLWLGLGIWVLGRHHRTAHVVTPLPSSIEDARETIGCGARFRISHKPIGPLTYGWWSPTVLLPEAFCSLSADAQTALACHELLHVRRRDWLHCLLEEAVRALFWFHPAVWMALSRLALSREKVIDREVIDLTGKRRAYLEALFEMAQSGQLRAVPAGASLLRRSDLKKRILAMSKELTMSKPRLTASLVAMTATLLLITGVAVVSLPLSASASQETQDESTPMRVEGDVEKPVKVHAPAPTYTELARKEKTQGKVIVQTVIDENGDVTDVEVLQGLPNGLTEQAIAAIEEWKFEPATLHGEPVSVYYNVTVNFRLE